MGRRLSIFADFSYGSDQYIHVCCFFSHEIKMTKCFCFVLPIENADDEFSELGEWRHYDLANVTCIFQFYTKLCKSSL